MCLDFFLIFPTLNLLYVILFYYLGTMFRWLSINHMQSTLINLIINSFTFPATQHFSPHRKAAEQQWCHPSWAPGSAPVSCSRGTWGRDGQVSAPIPGCVLSRGRSPWTGCVPCVRSASTSQTCRSGPHPAEGGRHGPGSRLQGRQPITGHLIGDSQEINPTILKY